MDTIRPHASRYGAAFVAALRSDWPVYAAAALYLAWGYAFLAGLDHMAFGMLNAYYRAWSINFGALAPLFVTIIGIVHITLRLKGRKALGYRAMFAPRRVGRFLAGTVLLLTAALLFTTMFSSIKTSFPLAHGFIHDVAQADIDKAIHFGVDPWRLLYAVAQHPLVLRALELNYNAFWFIICYGALYWVATSPRADGVRVRYILTWFASWIVVGNLMAGTWLSAGPVYYGHVTGDTARFAEQLAFLATTAGQQNSAHNFQAYLWHLYSSGQVGIGSGISAFPSMHVALATLNALFIGEVSRRWAAVMWAYVVLIIMSSVYLGWHYAIDGYAAVATVAALHWALRRLLPTLARLRWRAPAAAAVDVLARDA